MELEQQARRACQRAAACRLGGLLVFIRPQSGPRRKQPGITHPGRCNHCRTVYPWMPVACLALPTHYLYQILGLPAGAVAAIIWRGVVRMFKPSPAALKEWPGLLLSTRCGQLAPAAHRQLSIDPLREGATARGRPAPWTLYCCAASAPWSRRVSADFLPPRPGLHFHPVSVGCFAWLAGPPVGTRLRRAD